MVRRVRADRKRQSMAIHNCHDFHAFSALRCPDLCPAPLGHNEGCVDEAFFFVQCASVAKLVGNIRQHPPQNLIAAPSLKTPMYRFVVGIALRQHMPLRTRVENPQDCFKNATCRDGFASGTTIGNVLLRKMHPDPFPLLVRESNHPTFIADRLRPAILRWLSEHCQFFVHSIARRSLDELAWSSPTVHSRLTLEN